MTTASCASSTGQASRARTGARLGITRAHLQRCPSGYVGVTWKMSGAASSESVFVNREGAWASFARIHTDRLRIPPTRVRRDRRRGGYGDRVRRIRPLLPSTSVRISSALCHRFGMPADRGTVLTSADPSAVDLVPLRHDGQDRPYHLHVPDGADEGLARCRAARERGRPDSLGRCGRFSAAGRRGWVRAGASGRGRRDLERWPRSAAFDRRRCVSGRGDRGCLSSLSG